MKNIAIRLGLLAVLCISSVMSIEAQKFGYINSAEILQNLPDIKAANAELETLQAQMKAKLEKQIQTLQAKYDDLARKENQGEISPKELQEQAAVLREEELTLQQEEQGWQNQLLEKREELYSPILDAIETAIEEVARENDYLYIFDYSTGFLLYADESQDVSSLVKAKLGLQ